MMTKLYSGKIQKRFSDRVQFLPEEEGARRKDDEKSLSIVGRLALGQALLAGRQPT